MEEIRAEGPERVRRQDTQEKEGSMVGMGRGKGEGGLSRMVKHAR